MTDSTQPPLTAAEVRAWIAGVDRVIATWEATDTTPRASLPQYKACSVELHALLADMDNRPTSTEATTWLDFGGAA